MASTPFKHMPPVKLQDPSADEWTQGFWEAAGKQQLTATKCSDCGTFRVPPGRFCRNCNSQKFTFEPLPGTGTLFSHTVVRQSGKDDGGFQPYVPAVIEPDGASDIRFVSALVDCDPDDIKPGMKVKVAWHQVNEALTIPFWAPA